MNVSNMTLTKTKFGKWSIERFVETKYFAKW